MIELQPRLQPVRGPMKMLHAPQERQLPKTIGWPVSFGPPDPHIMKSAAVIHGPIMQAYKLYNSVISNSPPRRCHQVPAADNS